MACEENPELLLSTTRQLLSKSKLLLRDIEELLDLCTVTGPSRPRRRRVIQPECEASIEQDGETLTIEGFRFECAASRDELRSKTGVQRDAGTTHE